MHIIVDLLLFYASLAIKYWCAHPTTLHVHNVIYLKANDILFYIHSFVPSEPFFKIFDKHTS